ncbi:major type 1 subunit fimbrin (pilin) [Acinetobacter calcoaceticus]|uniref:Major type 1 subunit fimbrin (Pilin) n=1 Tax=Acinetobacter calcoaceticus TaxID=471 RepID=A0A4R1XNY5_ACICA|nr:major type 1 subunit fimbrin (pilin) [Acinetobacter calcoaceticus]
MNIKLLTASLITAATFSTVAFAADTPKDPVTVNGGTIKFTGEIVNAACAVNTQSANQTVDLGQHRTAALAIKGDKTPVVPFKIALEDCDPTVSATASVAFYGKATADGALLEVSSAGSNSPAAENVGIQITDFSNKVLGFTGTDFSTAKTLNAGKNELGFTAQYVATGTATPGRADAEATFVVKYQ